MLDFDENNDNNNNNNISNIQVQETSCLKLSGVLGIIDLICH